MLCTIVLLLLQETLCQVENPFQTIIQKDDPFSSSNPETVDIPGRNLDSAHAHFIDFWLKNPDAMLTDIPGIEFPPDSFAGSLSDTTTPIAATTSATVTTSAPATAAPPRTTQSTNDLRGGHGNGENCVGGVRRDSSGKITHIVDTHDCTLLPVISSDITFDHVIDPRTNEMIFITEPPEVATASQTTKEIITQTTENPATTESLTSPVVTTEVATQKPETTTATATEVAVNNPTTTKVATTTPETTTTSTTPVTTAQPADLDAKHSSTVNVVPLTVTDIQAKIRLAKIEAQKRRMAKQKKRQQQQSKRRKLARKKLQESMKKRLGMQKKSKEEMIRKRQEARKLARARWQQRIRKQKQAAEKQMQEARRRALERAKARSTNNQRKRKLQSKKAKEAARKRAEARRAAAKKNLRRKLKALVDRRRGRSSRKANAGKKSGTKIGRQEQDVLAGSVLDFLENRKKVKLESGDR